MSHKVLGLKNVYIRIRVPFWTEITRWSFIWMELNEHNWETLRKCRPIDVLNLKWQSSKWCKCSQPQCRYRKSIEDAENNWPHSRSGLDWRFWLIIDVRTCNNGGRLDDCCEGLYQHVFINEHTRIHTSNNDPTHFIATTADLILIRSFDTLRNAFGSSYAIPLFWVPPTLPNTLRKYFFQTTCYQKTQNSVKYATSAWR